MISRPSPVYRGLIRPPRPNSRARERGSSRRRRRTGLVAATVLALAGCENAGEDRILSIQATGVLEGVVYFDADGSREPSTPDGPAANVRVWLIAAGTVDTAARSTSDGEGLYTVADIPVGRYRVAVDTTTIGDTVVVARIDTAALELEPGDTTSVQIAVSFPKLGIQEARGAGAGTRMFVEGVALTSLGVYGDTTLHIADTSGAIRAARIARADVLAGDSVRLRGTRSVRDGQPILSDVTVFVLGVASSLPPAAELATADAAAAAGGTLDASLVRIVGTTLVDSSTTAQGDLQLTVDDGSGPLAVLLDHGVPFDLGLFALPGAEVEALGVLVPVATGEWALKPRSNADLDVTIEVRSTDDVRSLPLSARVFVDGIALNSRETFGDTTVHLADTAGAIRAVRVARETILPGDSIRIAGAVGRRDGQIVIDSAVPFVLALAEAPVPTSVTADEAAGARGGALDAALVTVSDAVIGDTATVTEGFQLQVDDNSGEILEVLLDRDPIPPALWATYVPGVTVDVTGLLVPTGSGAWRLKPRAESDLTVN